MYAQQFQHLDFPSINKSIATSIETHFYLIFVHFNAVLVGTWYHFIGREYDVLLNIPCSKAGGTYPAWEILAIKVGKTHT